MCKCGLGHRGWESNLCRIELAKRGDTMLSPSQIKPLLTDRSGSVSTKKAKSKPVSANTNKPSKPVSTNATRQAALKSRRVPIARNF